MMIHDADIPILDPHRAFLKIIVDRIVKALAGAALNPAGVGARRVETVEIGDQESTAGIEDARHLGDGRADVGNIDQGQIAYDEVEGIISKRQTLGRRFEICAARIARAGGSNQRGRRIHANDVYAMQLEHAAEAAFAATYIQRFLGRPREGAGKHDRVEHVASSEVAMFAHIRDPSIRRRLPAIVHDRHGRRPQSHVRPQGAQIRIPSRFEFARRFRPRRASLPPAALLLPAPAARRSGRTASTRPPQPRQPRRSSPERRSVELFSWQSSCIFLPWQDYRGWPRCRLHSPRTERMAEKSAVTPSARSVQTKKKPPLDCAILPPTPFPIMWMTGTPAPRSDPSKMMTYPDRRSASTSVPYSQTTRMGTATRFEAPPFSIPRTMSSVR